MTPMSEIAKCQCGAEARLSPPWSGRIRAVCVNDECDIRGPRALSEVEAVARWNALMRPRPVAEWVPAQGLRGDEPHWFVGSLRLGQVVLGHVSVHGIVAARCHIDGKGQYFLGPDPASARA